MEMFDLIPVIPPKHQDRAAEKDFLFLYNMYLSLPLQAITRLN